MRITLRLLEEELSACYPGAVSAGGGEELQTAVLLCEHTGPLRREQLYCCAAAACPPDAPEGICFLLAGPPTGELPKSYLLVAQEPDEQVLLLRVQSILLRLWSWCAEVLHISTDVTDLQSLVDVSGPLFPQGLSLLSVYHDRIFSSDVHRGDTGRWETLVRAYCDPDTTSAELPFDFVADLHSQHGPHIISLRGDSTEYLVCNIFIDDIRVGNIVAPLRSDQIRSCYFLYMQELLGCAERMLEAARSEEDDPLTGTVRRLLCGEQVAPETLQQLCAGEGWAEQGHTLRVSVIHAKEQARQQFRSGQLLFRNIISSIYYKSKVLIFDEDIVLVRDFTANDCWEESADSLDRLHYFLRQIHAAMGSSIPFSDLTQLRIFYEQARTVALSTEDPAVLLHEYSRYLPHDMISSFASSRPLGHYIHPEIVRLAEQDPRGSAGLLLSLYYYLLNDRSYQLCAEKQHIHRSSFAYRINKVLGVLTCNLNDENTRLSLLLSICMYWYLHPEADPMGISRWNVR